MALRDALDALDAAAAGERGARPRRRLGAAGTPAGCSTAGPTRRGWRCWREVHGAPDFTRRARRRPRLGGAGAGRADAGRGRALRGLRQPRPGAGAAEPDRARDRGGAGLRHRAPRDDAGLPARARPAGEAGFVARRVADIGGGTGVLAMAAARLWPARAIAGDIDPLATRDGAGERRGERRRRRGSPASPRPGFRHPRLRAGAPYDLIFANILAGPLRRLAPELARRAGAGRRRDPVGHPGAAGGGRARRPTAAGATGRGTRCAIGEWRTLVLRRGAERQRPRASSATSARREADVGELVGR